MPASQGRMVVVSGPSGAGKTSVMRRVYEECPLPLVRGVSATTRPPRPGETDGVDYYFLSEEEFHLRRQRGDFIECFEVFGYNHWYGTLRSEVTPSLATGKWVVLEIDVRGTREVVSQFPRAITIFLRPSSRDELRRRLRGRGTESVEALGRRLAQADNELALAGEYQYQVINDRLDRAVGDVRAILTQEWEKSRND